MRCADIKATLTSLCRANKYSFATVLIILPACAGEEYFQADKDDAGSQGGQDLAHAVHQAVGDMLSDSPQLPQGQVGITHYPTTPSKRIQSGGLSLELEPPAPYQAARMHDHATSSLDDVSTNSGTSLQQFLPTQAAVSHAVKSSQTQIP